MAVGSIRYYKDSDFATVKQWWDAAAEMAPLPSMLPTDSTFVFEINDQPALCISLYLTNCLEICYLENFAGNPEFKGNLRKEAATMLVNHCYEFAKRRGYKRVLCLAHRDKLKTRYKELGMTKTLDDVSTFVRELKE